ncbi:hypothetical protein PSD17_41180 [Pseudonocardia sp. D17]|nr:hypothetical protein PSD17_41180 [Pseudonocardia sp. D17]
MPPPGLAEIRTSQGPGSRWVLRSMVSAPPGTADRVRTHPITTRRVCHNGTYPVQLWR